MRITLSIEVPECDELVVEKLAHQIAADPMSDDALVVADYMHTCVFNGIRPTVEIVIR